MSFRSLFYWLVCSVLAAIAVHAADAAMVDAAGSVLQPPVVNSALILPVPEPSRAIMLFAGIMAMAFTYRKVWLNCKRAA